MIDHDKDKGAQDIDPANKKGIDHGTMKSSSRVRVDKGEGAPSLLHLGSVSSNYRQHHSRVFLPISKTMLNEKNHFVFCLTNPRNKIFAPSLLHIGSFS